MPDDPAFAAPLLKELYAFRQLNNEELAAIAVAGSLLELAEGETKQVGGVDAPFYVVVGGRISLQEIKPTNNQEELAAVAAPTPFKAGECFGADYLLFDRVRRFNLKAITKTTLFSLEARALEALLTKMPNFRTGILFALETGRLLHSKPFRWIGEDELVYLVARQHPMFLYVLLIQPLLVLLSALLLLLVGSLIPIASFRLVFQWVGLAVLAGAAGWAIWRYLDWANDYYVITDKRIAWLEQLPGFPVSPREVLLKAVRSIEPSSENWFERRFGYGNLSFAVAGGKVTFKGISHPAAVGLKVEELRRRADVLLQQEEVQEREKIIRAGIQRLEKVMRGEIELPRQPAPPPPAPKKKRLSLADLAVFFKIETRFERDKTITYRTHVFHLFRRLFLPGLFQVAVLILAVWLLRSRALGQITFPSGVTTILLALFLSAGLGAWALYHFTDWRNDIYQITTDKVADIDHKPFQDERVKEAFIKDILSWEIVRSNFLAMLFNYGTLVLNTGSETKLTFDDIPDPSRALQEINLQRFKNERAQKLTDIRKQAEQQVDVIAAYHRWAEEQRKSQDQEKPKDS